MEDTGAEIKTFIPDRLRPWLTLLPAVAMPIWVASIFVLGRGDGLSAVAVPALLCLAWMAWRAFERSRTHNRGEEVSPPNGLDWGLRLGTVVLGAAVMMLSRSNPAWFWPTIGILLAPAFVKFVSLDKWFESGNPFLSRRAAAVTEDDSRPRRLWVENAIGLVTALIFIVLSYTYFVEAFRIPTGSMEPTLFGHPVLGDRALVDKQAYQFSDPVRGDIAVFRFPQMRSQPYVKRVAGEPSESIVIANGDLWFVPPGEVLPKVWRKTGRLREEAWLPMLVFEGGDASKQVHFRGEKGRATAANGVITLDSADQPEARLRYPAKGGITNHSPLDGTPRQGLPYGTEPVGDVRISGRVRISESAIFQVAIRRGAFPGAVFRVGGEAAEFKGSREDGPGVIWFAANAGESVPFEFWLADAEKGGSAGGEKSTTYELGSHVAAVQLVFKSRHEQGRPLDLSRRTDVDALTAALPRLESCSIEISVFGGKAEVSELKIDRDFHYIGRMVFEQVRGVDGRDVWSRGGAPSLPMAFVMGSNEYLMLGDHTEDSEDSRAWILCSLTTKSGDSYRFPVRKMIELATPDFVHWPRIHNSVLGNPGAEEPAKIKELMTEGAQRGALGYEIAFLDIYGIPRRVAASEVETLTARLEPGVSRGLIDGKLLGSLFPSPRFVE